MMMKYVTLLCLSVVIFVAGCNNKKTEIENLQQENELLKQQSQEKDSTINSFFDSYNRIEENLAIIKEREDMIRNVAAQGDVGEDATERINNDIQVINELMEENKRVIANLQKQLKASNMKITEFETTIASLMEQIEMKDAEIVTLRQQLEDMNFEIQTMALTIDTMAVDIAQKRGVIEEQSTSLNRAHYVIGTEKELKNDGIIKKEGGFIGIGRTAKLSESFNKKFFTEIDIRKVTSIPIDAKSATLETVHPAGSYKFIGDDKIERIEITDPHKFWSTSKYLVVVTK